MPAPRLGASRLGARAQATAAAKLARVAAATPVDDGRKIEAHGGGGLLKVVRSSVGIANPRTSPVP